MDRLDSLIEQYLAELAEKHEPPWLDAPGPEPEQDSDWDDLEVVFPDDG